MKGRGRRGRGGHDSPLVAFSKRLSWALRHGIHELGLSLNPAGFVRLSDLLRNPKFRDMNVDIVRQIVAEDEKQRYTLQDTDGELWIRANQGHTVTDVKDEELLEEIRSPEKFPFIVHGTQRVAWETIQYRGLYRMNRNHIRTPYSDFAIGLPGAGEVISGARVSCDVFIQVDIVAAMRDGIKFFVSTNRVVLTSGKFGFLSPKYFTRVWVDRLERQFIYRSVALDYLLVLDFEANCVDKGKLPCQEIIEFPVLAVSVRTKRIEHRFHTYVRPVVVPVLTPFCTELTGITQDQVNPAPDLPETLSNFHNFMTTTQLLNKKTAFATCGDWDLRTCLPSECNYKKLPVPDYFKVWVNVKMLFPLKVDGMMEMLQVLGLEHHGRHHSGLDDAENIANALITLLEAGIGFGTTDIHGAGIKPGQGHPDYPLSDALQGQVPGEESKSVPH